MKPGKPETTRRPTIRDVASEAGVSVSSVSRALNGGFYTSAKSSARIMKAVERLGFEPQSAAQSLRSRSSQTIGCMVADFSNPHYTAMVSAAEREFQRAGYLLMLAATGHDERQERAFLSAVRRRGMDGVLLFAGDGRHRTFAGDLANLQVPHVAIDRKVPNGPTIRIDHRGGAFEVTRHLLKLGHRRIALLTGGLSVLPTSERLVGYRKAHREAGVDVDPRLIRPHRQGTVSAHSTTSELLELNEPPSAIITLGTGMLAEVLTALTEKGLDYPENISIVCTGDTDLARHAKPAVSALSWDMEEVGRVAARLLIEGIADPVRLQSEKTVHLPTRLIVRQSCGPVPVRNTRSRRRSCR